MKFLNVKTVEETLALIEAQFAPIRSPVRVPLREAVGRVLAEDVRSPEPVPSFARSTVDGYAVAANATYGASDALPALLDVAGRVEMGKAAGLRLAEGQAAYIPTGGMLPEGADSVVMIEHAEEVGTLLSVYRQVAPGENVIRAGDDIAEGGVALRRGRRLRAQDLGVLAAIGVSDVAVAPAPIAAVLSTGDEIVPPATKTLAPGEVRDANGVMIGARLAQWGARVIDGGIVRDDYDLFLSRAVELFREADVLFLSGGSSMGTRDYTVNVLETLGEPGVLVHGVATKPGKPTIVGKAQGKPVIGLPGHPVSAMIMLDLLGAPLLARLQGETAGGADKRVRARLSRNVASAPGRTDFVRVRLEERGDELWAIPVFGKSGLVSTLADSDGVAEIAAPKEGVLEGEWVKVRLYEQW